MVVASMFHAPTHVCGGLWVSTRSTAVRSASPHAAAPKAGHHRIFVAVPTQKHITVGSNLESRIQQDPALMAKLQCNYIHLYAGALGYTGQVEWFVVGNPFCSRSFTPSGQITYRLRSYRWLMMLINDKISFLSKIVSLMM